MRKRMKIEEYTANDYEIKAPKRGDTLQLYKFILKGNIRSLEGMIERKIKLDLNIEKSKLLKIINQIKKTIDDYENISENVYVLNEYVKLKYENRTTQIYVKGKRFLQCIRLVLNIRTDKFQDYDQINSIDEAADVNKNKTIWRNRIVVGPGARPDPTQNHDITPEQEFIGHCSNMEAWVENDYNTQLLHRSIAFPLLKKLVAAGDPKAKRAYKEELAYRLESNELNVAIFLIKNRYLKDLDHDELEIIIDNMKPGIVKIILQENIMSINFDDKKMALIVVPYEVYLTSYKRNNFTYRDYKKPFNLKFLFKYSRVVYDSLVDFGITWNGQKVLFKKSNILKASKYFTDKDVVKVEIPRSKAPLKLSVESENLAIYIYPKLLF